MTTTVRVMTTTHPPPDGIEVLCETTAANGLVIHKTPTTFGADETWTVTHAQSGFALLKSVSREQAVAFCVKVAGIADWTRQKEELDAELGKAGPFRDATMKARAEVLAMVTP